MDNSQKKTKILHIITKSNWGGAQKYAYDLAVNTRSSFDVAVALGGRGELKIKLEEKGIKTIDIGSRRNINVFNDIKTFFILLKVIVSERPDVVHLNSSKIGGLGALTGRILRKKVVFTAHGWAFNEDRNFLAKKVIKFLAWITIALSHKTIAVSEQVLKDVMYMPFVKKKVEVVYNGISDINLKTKNEARRVLLGDEADDFSDSTWIGTISELHKNKGVEYALCAISNIKNKKLIFVIIGEGEERDRLESLAKEKGLENNVFFVGQKKDAASLLSAFDILTLTSTTEAFAYVLLETGLASLPSVASNVGGVPEIIEDKKTGILVKSKNTKDIKGAIEFLLENKEEAKVMGQNLNKKVREQFTTEKMIEKTISLYKNLLEFKK